MHKVEMGQQILPVKIFFRQEQWEKRLTSLQTLQELGCSQTIRVQQGEVLEEAASRQSVLSLYTGEHRLPFKVGQWKGQGSSGCKHAFLQICGDSGQSPSPTL